MAQLENFRLKVFRAVAAHLSFRKAAEHLFLTQPAVTLQIKALENDLGIRLFDRSGNRVALTPQGRKLLTYANKIADLASAAERDLAAEDGEFSGELSIGLIEGPARHRGVHIEPFMRDELILIVPPNSDSTQFSAQKLLASNLL